MMRQSLCRSKLAPLKLPRPMLASPDVALEFIADTGHVC